MRHAKKIEILAISGCEQNQNLALNLLIGQGLTTGEAYCWVFEKIIANLSVNCFYRNGRLSSAFFEETHDPENTFLGVSANSFVLLDEDWDSKCISCVSTFSRKAPEIIRG